MTDEDILANLMLASPSFATSWRLTESHYPPSDPETLPSALYVVTSQLHGLVVKDRRGEVAPLLAAIERAYEGATPSQRVHIRRCVIEILARDCADMGLDPELFWAHLGPQCRAVWSDVVRPGSVPPVA